MKEAEILFAESSDILKKLALNASKYLPESQLTTLTSRMYNSQCLNYSFAHSATDHAAYCFDNALFFKGFLLASARQVQRVVSAEPSLSELYRLFKQKSRELAELYTKPLSAQSNITDLENILEKLEKELVQKSSGLGNVLKQVSWNEVQAALKPGEAALELVVYQFKNPNPTDSIFIAALLLLPGDAAPRFIPLFEEKQLDSLLQTQGERKADYTNKIYSLPDRGAKPIGKPTKTVYELVWQPLESSLKGIHKVYYAPAGLLHRLNLAAIPVGPDSVLADRYELVELGSTRQLVVPSLVQPVGDQATLFGGIQYEIDSTAVAARPDSASVAIRGVLNFDYSDSTLRGSTWNYLPYTEKEIAGISQIMATTGFKTKTFSGQAATEEAFKSIGQHDPSPRIIHLATHGFFFPDPKERTQNFPLRIAAETGSAFQISNQPMIRSGLILAGGNYAWQHGHAFKPTMEDGILTAYEISQMDLSHTELVVLSACETGLGDIKGNEGVYGLQRAFKIAGVKYLIMSLWQVPDKETAFFMTVFYRHMLEGGMAIPEAFRATQKELRENPFSTPYQWAGFVLVE